MKHKVAILFAGLAFLTAVPAQAESAIWTQSIEKSPASQTSEFTVQDVGFKRSGFKRRGFRRGSFRHGVRRGFRRRGFRHGFKRGRVRNGFRKGSFRHGFGFGNSHVKRSFGSFGLKHGGFFNHGFSKFGRFRNYDRDRRLDRENEADSSAGFTNSLNESAPVIDSNESQSQDANSTRQSFEIIGGGLDDSSLLTEGIQEASPEEVLGVELHLIPESEQN